MVFKSFQLWQKNADWFVEEATNPSPYDPDFPLSTIQPN
jgi:hypothetical protein